jgi:hypothetical protein
MIWHIRDLLTEIADHKTGLGGAHSSELHHSFVAEMRIMHMLFTFQ